MRTKNQGQRREQLKSAARAVLLEHGAVSLRVKDIAAEAGMAPSSVLYYYPDIGDLLLDVARGAMERYAEQRAATVAEVDGAIARLRLAIDLGVPTGPDDEDSRLLYEIDALTGISPAFRVLSAAFFDRQVHLYETLIEAGTASGELEPAASAASIARGIVAMEDGLGLQVVLGHSGIDREAARRILLEYATAMVGAELAAAPR
ncbi:MAG TPA: TetR family transcriptional regulator C-terminal domain-containing protein [Solirubrobacterales bacterium]|jgi:AcrR family transcriptional regulator|nr:TetR family transcriptional regulator C-terminal domain-containing protein [Solirubrobacterales bacterium]